MRKPRPGYSIIELVFTLSVVGVLAGISVPAAVATRDRLSVRAARNALTGELARTRAAAIERGGAALEIDAAAGVLRVLTVDGDTIGDPLHLAQTHGVRLEIGGTVPLVAVRFDALGIGRLANRTVVLRRGGAEARIAVSAYGRWRDS
jgi:type II secretory pathway pseudopilin PulG